MTAFSPTKEQNRAALLAAIKAARANQSNADEAHGLYATRRLYHDDVEWLIDFENPSFATVIADDFDISAHSDEEIASIILNCWEDEWDDIANENRVGNFQIGSSDFRGRGQ